MATHPPTDKPHGWDQWFSEEERRGMLQEDSDTWGSVIPLLLFIIIGGVLGMALAVAYVVGAA